VVTDAGASRRALLSGAGATLTGAVALTLGGCGHPSTGRKAVKQLPRPQMERDVRILGQALELERRTVAAYVAGIPLLSHPLAKVARQFLNEELQHTGELISLITAAGAQPAPRADSYELGHPRDAGGVLRLVHSLEALQIKNYLQSIPRLSAGPVRAAVASILTVDSQHITMLRLAQGQTPVPSAFVTGSE
jgi:Ferritin-like domain